MLLLLAASLHAQQPVARFDEHRHIEYLLGDAPVILSAPHGGRLKPDDIPDRPAGVTITDTNTDRLAREFAEAFFKHTGRRPHVIICHLKRTKVDCNRPLSQAANGNERAAEAWNHFHRFIETARESVIRSHGKGLYIDLHAHGHETQWLELGYLLRRTELNRDDAALEALRGKSSFKTLRPDLPFVRLLRGPESFGALMQQRGYRTVPSPGDPGPGEGKYFSGGYNTRRHGSRDGGPISGFQLETPRAVRMKTGPRRAFAEALAEAVAQFMKRHLSFRIEKDAKSAP